MLYLYNLIIKRNSFNTLLSNIIFVIPVLFFIVQNVNASQTVIQDIKLLQVGTQIKIDIEFGLPLLYMKHFPQKSGEIIQIQLQLNEEADRNIHKEVRQGGDIKAPRDLEDLLVYVTYEEGVPGGPYLTLRFSHSVEFEVQTGSSLQTLTVLVTDKALFAKSQEGVDIADEAAVQSKRRPRQGAPEDTVDDSQVDEMMAKARQTLTFGDATGAIELLRKIIRMPEHKQTQSARELLGLALERSNQIPRAKFEYKKYLSLYNKGEGPTRVQQRLAALQNLGVQRKEKLRPSRRSLDDDEFRLFGRWSQSYSSYYVQSTPENDTDAVDPGDFIASRNASSYLNLNGRYRGKTKNIQTSLALSHNYDYIRSDKTDERISYLNVEYDGFKQGVSAVLGRQRARNTGVFGRFDGVIAGYRSSPSIKSSIYLGEPVNFFDGELYKKRFYGGSLDIGEAKAPFNGNLYYIHQTVDLIHDRAAVGGVMKYSQKTMSIFGQVDYDIEFKEMSTSSLRWGWQAFEKTKFNVSYIRRSDLLTSKAVFVLGANPTAPSPPPSDPDPLDPQFVPLPEAVTLTIDKYKELGLSEEQIQQIAKLQSSESENLTAGFTYQIDKDRQFNFDVSVFSATGNNIEDINKTDILNTMIASGGDGPAIASALTSSSVANIQGTDNQFLYSFQWISNNTFVERDLHMLGFRYADYTTYDEYSLFVNSRLPPVRNWNPRPRLNISHRNFNPAKTNSSFTQGSMNSIKPSIKVDYRWKKAWVFDIEIGVEHQVFVGSDNATTDNWSLNAGYNYTF